MEDKWAKIGVVDRGFESKAMFEGNSKGIDEIDCGDLAQQIPLSQLRVFWVLPLNHMEPNETCQISRRQCELRPILPSIVVSFVSCRDSEGETERNDKTKNSEQNSVDSCRVILATTLDLLD